MTTTPITMYKKTNFKQISVLNIKPEILKVLKQTTGRTLHDRGKEKDFLNSTPFVQELRPTNSLKVF